MNVRLIALLLLYTNLIYSQDYNFDNNGISQNVLENYLERSVTMSGLYNVYRDQPSQFLEEVQFLANIDAKFIGRAAGLWGEESKILNTSQPHFDQVEGVVSSVSDEYSLRGLELPIFQASIFEIVTDEVNDIPIGAIVAQEFGDDPNRKFDFLNMTFDNYPQSGTIWGSDPTHIWPDITKRETQMWFFYLAINYIDAGIEAIHFGQMDRVGASDQDNVELSNLLDKIRNYALGQNRGWVLCDAHTYGAYEAQSDNLIWDFHSYPLRVREDNSLPGNQPAKIDILPSDAIYGNSLGGVSPSGWSTNSLPYLVEFDNYQGGFGTGVYFPHGMDEITWFANQNQNYRNDWLRYAYYKSKCLDPVAKIQFAGRRTIGNLTGTYRAANGQGSQFFNQENTIKDIWDGGNSTTTSSWGLSNFTESNILGDPPNIGGEVIFSNESTIYYVNEDGTISGYFFNGVSWEIIEIPTSNGGSDTQVTTLDGSVVVNSTNTSIFFISSDFLFYEIEILTNGSYQYNILPVNAELEDENIKPRGSLISTSDDRMYFVADEGNTNEFRVYGLVKINNEWELVSPSHLSGNVANQVQPRGKAPTLISNVSGNRLFYIGRDRLIHCFNIIDNLTYNYFPAPTNVDLVNQGVRVQNSLICPNDFMLFYVGTEIPNNGAARIHGITMKENLDWGTISPSHSQANATSQMLAVGSIFRNGILTATNDLSNIAYIGEDGNIYGFHTEGTIYDYEYFNFVNLPSSEFAHSIMFHDNKLYVSSPITNSNGNQTGSGDLWSYCLSFNNCENSEIKVIEPNCCSIVQAPVEIDLRIGKKDIPLKGNFTVRPNPIRSIDSYFMIETKDIKLNPSSDIIVSNLSGQILKIDINILNEYSALIEFFDQPNGLYLITIEGVSQKIIFIK